MKRCICFLLVFMLAAATTLAQPGKTEQQILDLSKRKFEWLISNKTDSLKVVLDEQVKYIHSNGWTQNKQEVLGDFASGKLVYQKIEISEAAVRLYGPTAIVTGKGKFSGLAHQVPFALDLMYTEVYILENNQWLLTSRHSNKMP